jgi:dipeptidyl aminopeptidase/acylaminoacyl peptidase
MLTIEMKLYLLFVLILKLRSSIQTKPTLTLDEFFDYTSFPSLSLSPNGQNLLIQTLRPSWDSNSFENSLWLYETKGQRTKLITKKLSRASKPKWSPSGNWLVLLLDENSASNTTNDHHRYLRSSESHPKKEQHIYLYCVASDELLPVQVGREIPTAITWSNNDSSLYFAAITSRPTKEEDDLYEAEWKDVIQYRQRKPSDSSTIHRIDIDRKNPKSSAKINIIKNVSFPIGELLFVPSEQKLVFTSGSERVENLDVFEIYSIDLRNLSSLARLTNNEALEQNLQLSTDGKNVLFQVYSLSSSNGKLNDTQQRLYSVDLTNGQIERLGKDFDGNIMGYATRSDGGVYILGQLGTNVQIYTQQSPAKYSILHRGWNGTYESITSASFSLKRNSSIAFVYSSFGRPQEVYFVDNIDRLQSAKAITSENRLFTRRNLPQAKVYTWISDEDDRTIEGILHYPPGKFEFKNLPLLVLIHGGPYSASINRFDANRSHWVPLAASEGWLVLEPNYRGSTGYGDQFLSQVRYQPLSRPGRDILSAVDSLIKADIADPNSLAVGGYSYGGLLTNWLITQTTRFNAALSGAGAVEYVSFWGTTDLPVLTNGLYGGFPWEVPRTYQNESPIYQLDKVRTPTHIVTGANDMRVPVDQSYILERGLYSLGIPVKLLLLPNEGHTLSNNPWHGKIKIREELKWLQKYGQKSSITAKN